MPGAFPRGPLRPQQFQKPTIEYAVATAVATPDPIALVLATSTPGAITTLTIKGITRDVGGVVLGSCTVKLFRSDLDAILQTTTSDASTGVYKFQVEIQPAIYGASIYGQVGYAQTVAPTAYYIVSYKAGAPDVAGTTVNTLVAV
jgi:hypothetical protein